MILTREAASVAVSDIGWRYLLGMLLASVPVRSLSQAHHVASAAITATSPEAAAHLRLDLRPDRVELSLQTRDLDAVTEVDVTVAERITHAVRALGLEISGHTAQQSARPMQVLELAIDAMDVGAVRPFWKAVMAYVDQPGHDGPEAGLVDPAGQLPSIWFQQMESPRPQRNRIHLDITVAHDEALERVRSALDAGGRLVSDARARAFWILADVEGNEVCVCTWQDRDHAQ